MIPPLGYVAFEHDDGTVHAVDVFDGALPVWRGTPVCNRATGVSSDEDGKLQTEGGAHLTRLITCHDCIAILG